VTAAARSDRGIATTVLLRCGIVAGPLFVAALLVEGATRSGYSPLRHPVSSLALGDGGWTQVVNFVVVGALYLAFAVGLLRARRQGSVGPRIGAVLIGAVAVGLLGAGAFVTDPVSGYPPGSPDALTSYSTSGALHDAFSAGTFLGLPAAALTFAWWFRRHGNRRWAGYSIGTALAFLAGFLLTSVAFSQAPTLVAYGGLYQRTTVVIGFTWLTLLAIHTNNTLISLTSR
jgi:hypothetical protein